ncbi:hypothetical protein OF001_U20227 [Pseudomonas sp. OF001]|nr:hypothetical protein OF001_U20227 [Pseudomonas sp. OF001]
MQTLFYEERKHDPPDLRSRPKRAARPGQQAALALPRGPEVVQGDDHGPGRRGRPQHRADPAAVAGAMDTRHGPGPDLPGGDRGISRPGHLDHRRRQDLCQVAALRRPIPHQRHRLRRPG